MTPPAAFPTPRSVPRLPGHRVLVGALAVAAIVGGTAAGRWRFDTLRQGLRARVSARLAGAATLTREAAAQWARERVRDVERVGTRTPALDPGAPARALPSGEGYAGSWVVRAGAADPTLNPAELDAAARVGADSSVHLVGPFAAATPSGVAVSVVGPAADVPGSVHSAVVLRADPAQSLLPLTVQRVRPGSEVARLLAPVGARVRVVAPAYPNAVAPYALSDEPAAGPSLAISPAVTTADAPAQSTSAVYRTQDGRTVLAAFARVPGTGWFVERRVDAAEIDVHAWAGLRTEAALLLAALTAVGLGALAASRAERAHRLRGQVQLARQREAAAVALRASEAGARAFVEHAPYGICRVSPDGRFTAVNPALVAMLGYPDPPALLAADLGQLYVDPGARARLLGRHAEGEAVVRDIETRWRRADGSDLPVRLHSREERDGTVVSYYEAYVTDLRALRSAEEALRQAEKLAAVGGFVSGVAHELNNPLSAVLLFTDGLLDDPGRSTDDHEALTLVREQALRARAIVRDLLAFVRGAGGTSVTVAARDVLERAARALAPQVAAEGGRLDIRLAPDLGWVHVDRPGVEQVVTNLVLNAAQAAPGGVVCLAAERKGGVLRVVVEDRGPGIPPAVLARIFEPFFTTKPVGVGTGLGLSVSLGIVERYGGTLAAANRTDGTGAQLTFTLPLVAAPTGARAAGAADDAPAPPDATHEAPNAVSARPPRVLVVDDEAPLRLALTRFFTRRGWAVDEAADGRSAFARLLDAEAAGAAYDLVLSDVRMPDVSGIALHDWVARTRPALLDRLVFATGDLASPESAAFVQRTGCLVLEKPFEPGALDALARGAIARAESGAETAAA